MTTHHLAIIGGDGVGPEVTAQALKVLEAAEQRVGFSTTRTEYDLGGRRYLASGEVRPDSVMAELDEAEASLTAEDPEGASVIARQEAMKRVGLLRVLRNVRDGGMGYPLEAAVEDTVVDYWLERLGRYRATPLTDPGAPLARGLLSVLSRLGG